jgi:hypothetical protein
MEKFLLNWTVEKPLTWVNEKSKKNHLGELDQTMASTLNEARTII